MGETTDDFNALKEFLKNERQGTAEINIVKMQSLNIPAREQSKNVFRVDSVRGAIMYYPTSSKWQHVGKIYHGSVEDFRAWLKRRNFLK